MTHNSEYQETDKPVGRGEDLIFSMKGLEFQAQKLALIFTKSYGQIAELEIEFEETLKSSKETPTYDKKIDVRVNLKTKNSGVGLDDRTSPEFEEMSSKVENPINESLKKRNISGTAKVKDFCCNPPRVGVETIKHEHERWY